MGEIDLKEIFNMFWSKKFAVIVIMLIFIIIGGVYTLKFTEPEYTSTITLLLISSKNTENGTATITTGDITLNSKLVATYSDLIKSENVLEEVISNTGIGGNAKWLRNNISVKAVKNTQLIEVAVKNETATNANKIANELAKVFTQKVSHMYNINNIQVLNEADLPTSPSNINHKKDIIMFAGVGLVIGICYVIIANLLDVTIKTAEGVEKEFNLSVLASVPSCGNKSKKEELIVHEDPKSPISETFRTLRTNIQFITKQQLKTILVTSTLPQEGKSFVSANLAVTFAQAGKKVVLVDADMRKGRQYSIFNILPKPGLSNCLVEFNENNDIKLTDYIQETTVENLTVISAGNIPPNPSELLVSEAMESIIEKLKETFDIVILDGPPTQLVTDSLILTRVVDATIIVTACNETKKDNLHKIIESILNVGGKISGIVVNKVPVSAKEYKQNYYYGTDLKHKNKETKQKELQENKEEKEAENNSKIEKEVNNEE